MRITAAFTRTLLAVASLLFLAFLALPAVTAINAYGLGASYDSTQSNVIFRSILRAPRESTFTSMHLRWVQALAQSAPVPKNKVPSAPDRRKIEQPLHLPDALDGSARPGVQHAQNPQILKDVQS